MEFVINNSLKLLIVEKFLRWDQYIHGVMVMFSVTVGLLMSGQLIIWLAISDDIFREHNRVENIREGGYKMLFKWAFIFTPAFWASMLVPLFFLFLGFGWIDFSRGRNERYYGHIIKLRTIKDQLLFSNAGGVLMLIPYSFV